MAIVHIMAKITDGTGTGSGEIAALYTNLRGRVVGCLCEWSVAVSFVHGMTDLRRVYCRYDLVRHAM